MSDDLSKKMKWLQDFEVVYGEETEEVEQTEFSSMLEENATKSFQEGEVFKGQVINIGADYVTVDIGYKQEGLVSVKEFQNYDGTLKIKKDDEIEVYLEKLLLIYKECNQ